MEWKKREDASEMVLLTMIWSVGSILITRLWFELTGNPKIAFGGWHIAHVLFGGMAMMASILIEMIYVGKKPKNIAVVLGGIGWGLFIDEVGKFVTMDNDYWFRPAVIIIYISFVLMFLLYRRLAKGETDGGMDLKILKLGARILNITYDKLLRRRMILVVLSLYSVYFSVDKIVDAVNILLSQEKMVIIERFYRDYDFFSRTDTYMIGFKTMFDTMAAVLFVVGWYWMSRNKRDRAVGYFQQGLLVNILLVSIFKFYFEQFSGVFWLVLNVLMWWLLGELKAKHK